MSDLDARVIDELLSDPAFLESLLEEGVELGQGDDDSVGGMEGNSTIASSSRSVLAPTGEVTSAPKSSGYESVTMQVVEELQDSVKGILAKVSAAFESAGVNRGRSSLKLFRRSHPSVTIANKISKQNSSGSLWIATQTQCF